MGGASLPADEELRLRTLYAYEILDTIEEQTFDDFCEIAAAICNTPTSLITLLDRERQWFKARKGFPLKETERDCSFCAHTLAHGTLMVVEDTTRDSRFVDNRLVVSGPGIRFYAGVPVRADNQQPLGTLCVIDTRPRDLEPAQRTGLEALARHVENELELRRMQRDKGLLARFVVHDLRNHLTAMLLGARGALDSAQRGKASPELLKDVADSTDEVHRQIENFHSLLASERDTLPMQIDDVDLEQLVGRVRGFMAGRFAEHELTLETSLRVRTVRADADLLRRVLENLVDNAIKAAPRGSTVRIDAHSDKDHVVLRVADEGPGVPAEQREAIFQTGVSGGSRNPRQGTGLGLAFCRMATTAMGGHVAYEPVQSGTGAIFRVTLPV